MIRSITQRGFFCAALIAFRICFVADTLDAQPASAVANKVYRLQFDGHVVDQGLYIDAFNPNGPLSLMSRADKLKVKGRVEKSDVIIAIDGQPVRGLADYHRAMENARRNKGRVRLTIRDNRTGQPSQWYADAVTVVQDIQTISSLKIEVKQAQQGLRIVRLLAGSPLGRMANARDRKKLAAAEPGDILVGINGFAAKTIRELDQISGQLNGDRFTVSLLDVKTGKQSEWIAAAARQRPIVTPPGKRKIHFLFCGLTRDPFIGNAIARSLEKLQESVRHKIQRQWIGSMVVLKDGDCNAENIVRTIDRMNIDPRDTLFCYYLGHGGYDPDRAAGDVSGGHFFAIRGGDLLRKTLFERLQAKDARLTVLVSDTCNVRSSARIAGSFRAQIRTRLQQGFTRLEKLLLFHRGEVDISASSRDEMSWSTPVTGCWFTESFCQVFAANDSWRPMMKNLRDAADGYFLKMRGMILEKPNGTDPKSLAALKAQTHLSPQAFRLDVKNDPYLGSPPGQREVVDRFNVLLQP